MSEPSSALDARALIAAVRQGDETALDRAYRLTFGHEMGRLVLAHHLAQCGVGDQLGAANLKYAAGKHDGALQLAAMAGFDPAAIAVGVLTGDLEESGHEEPERFAFDALADEEFG
jgi:hypothetical protein